MTHRELSRDRFHRRRRPQTARCSTHSRCSGRRGRCYCHSPCRALHSPGPGEITDVPDGCLVVGTLLREFLEPPGVSALRGVSLRSFSLWPRLSPSWLLVSNRIVKKKNHTRKKAGPTRSHGGLIPLVASGLCCQDTGFIFFKIPRMILTCGRGPGAGTSDLFLSLSLSLWCFPGLYSTEG